METHDGVSGQYQSKDGHDAVQKEALRRHRQGWRLVALRPSDKKPKHADWLDKVYEDEDEVRAEFHPADPERVIAAPGLGVLTGRKSGGLVVVDLDRVEPAIAALALPATDLIDGRPSRPLSHWFYVIAGKGMFDKETINGSAGQRLLEVLGDGQQAVLPPSKHAEGEQRAWVKDGEPAKVDAEELVRAANRAGAFQEIADLWTKLAGMHHECSLPLAGGLLRCRIDPDTIVALFDLIWPTAERDEVHNSVYGTAKRLEEGETVSGWPRLRELCPGHEAAITSILVLLGVPGADDDRPRVLIAPGMLDKATKDGWAALEKANAEQPALFRQANRAVRVETDEKGRPIIQRLDMPKLRYHANESIRWLQPTKTGGAVPANPSKELVENMLATPAVPLPALRAVVSAPVIGPDGTIRTQPGYHAGTQTFYQPLPGFAMPDVPVNPTPGQIAAARRRLLDELLGDFPFDGEASRANALAYLLLPFGRSVIDGPTPLHVIEAPMPGTGKSLLAELGQRIAVGPAGAAAMAETGSDEEMRKRITSALMTGSPFIFIDNVTGRMDLSSLAKALTQTMWEDRPLHTNELVKLDQQAVWAMTSNNAMFGPDFPRRSVPIRLDAMMEKPEDRTGFKIPNIRAWTALHRAELVGAALTLWRAWFAKGQPKSKANLGSFEEWAGVMGGVLDTAGVPGFLANHGAFTALAAPDTSRFHELVDAWWRWFGTDDVKPKELYEQVARDLEGFDYERAKGETGKLTMFGNDLRSYRDKVHNDRRVTVRMEGGKPLYSLESLKGEVRTAAIAAREDADIRTIAKRKPAAPAEDVIDVNVGRAD